MAIFNMKKIITLFMLTFIVSFSYSQQYTPMTAAGYQYKRAKVDSTLHIPSFCGVPTLRNSTAIQGALAMDTCANKLYQWTNAAGWSIISGGGGGGTLQSVTDSGNTTTNDIQLLNHARVILGDSGEVLLDNGSKLRMGAIDAQTGGSKGIAQVCAVGYELKWEGGSLYIMNDQGLTIREVRYKFNSIPTTTDDGSRGFYPGSRWVLDNGDLYICSDSTSAAAVWQLNVAATPTLQEVTTAGATTVDVINLNDNIAGLWHTNLNTLVSVAGLTQYYPIKWNDDFSSGYGYIKSYDDATGNNLPEFIMGTTGVGTSEIKLNTDEISWKHSNTTKLIPYEVGNDPGYDYTLRLPVYDGYAIKDTLATLKDLRGSGSGGTVTSVDLTMPSAFNVTGNPVTTSGTLAVTGAGTVSQYVRGDGTLANFPNSTGGGASVNYYLNGSVSQGTFGGDTYYEMSKTPVIGGGTNFIRTNGAGNGYIASFITDAGDPNQLNIPGGNWNVEFYFNSSSSGGTPSFYGELYKVSATNVFTLIASGSANPEGITNGTAVDQYFTSIPVPQTTLLLTDRLAVRIFVTTGGRTITMHTENGNLAEVLTTFTTGLTALNGLTEQVQNFAVGTSGTDFNISSATATHTFNLPTASATNRGALSSANWSTFNSKLGASDTVSLSNRINLKVNIADTSSMLTPYLRKIDTTSLSNRINLKVNISDTASMLTPYLRKIDTTNRFVNNISRTVGKDSIIFNIGSTRYAIKDSVGGGGGSAAGSTGNIQFNSAGAFAGSNNLFWDNTNTRLGIGQTSPTSRFHLNFNQNSVTQSDANGILLANTTAAISGTQSISPAIVWQGNGWKTTATAASQDVRFRADVLPVQGTANPTATWTLASSINGGSYINRYQTSSSGSHTFYDANGTSLLTLNNTGTITSGQFKSGSNTATSAYRTTNAGSDVTPTAFFGASETNTAGTLAYATDVTNGLAFTAANGTRPIARAGINITNLVNTAGSEAGDMIFSTQTGGTAMSEKMRISSGGNVLIGSTADAGYKLFVNGSLRWANTGTLLTLGYTSNRGIALQIGGTATYKTTNAGATLTPVVNIAPNGETSGAISLNYDFNNGLGLNFAAGNGTNIIARAGINITNLVNTVGSESGDMIFLTQSGGTAMSEKMRITGAGGLTINATNTATGTTGNQTINKASGTVNIAAAGTTVTVTNSLVTTSSIVYAVIRTNDASATIKNVVPAAGSFVINLGAAATAEVSIGFFVIN